MKFSFFSIALNVKDLEVSLGFYQKLGFTVIEGGHESKEMPDTDDAKWRMMQQGETKIGLFQGMFPDNILTFHTQDMPAVRQSLQQAGLIYGVEEDSEEAIILQDPDSNPILFDPLD